MPLGQVVDMLEWLDALDARQSALLGRVLARQGSFLLPSRYRRWRACSRAARTEHRAARTLCASGRANLALVYLADLLRVRCEHAEATRLFEAARVIFEEIGDRGGVREDPAAARDDGALARGVWRSPDHLEC